MHHTPDTAPSAACYKCGARDAAAVPLRCTGCGSTSGATWRRYGTAARPGAGSGVRVAGEWQDDVADLPTLVHVTREDDRDGLAVLARFADRDACLACAVKLLAELASDAGFCHDHFRE